MRIHRGADPGPFADYRDYKPHLRPTFRARCSYCMIPDDQFGGMEGMTVDHFLPRVTAGELLTAWKNLYYCCSVCNSHYKKGRPTTEEEAEGLGFIDPCRQDPDKHFRLVTEAKTGFACEVKGRTKKARYVVTVLRLNWRPFLRDFWRELDVRDTAGRQNLKTVEGLIRTTRARLKRTPTDAHLIETLRYLNTEKAKIQNNLVEIASRRPFPLEKAV